MKIRHLLAVLTCLIAPLFAFAEDNSPTELDDTMEQMNTAYRKLTRIIANPANNAEALKSVAAMREHALEALKFEPKKKADLPAADQAKFVADYQAGMKALIADLDKLEAAIKAGKNDEAAAMVKGLKQKQEEGHKQFKKGKDDKKAA